MSNGPANSTTDLVARLRAERGGQAVDLACALDDLCIEAADAIERLRSALLVAKEFASWSVGATELKRVHATIDAALSGTEP